MGAGERFDSGVMTLVDSLKWGAAVAAVITIADLGFVDNGWFHDQAGFHTPDGHSFVESAKTFVTENLNGWTAFGLLLAGDFIEGNIHPRGHAAHGGGHDHGAAEHH